MSDTTVISAIVDELNMRGYQLEVEQHQTDLISLGLNSVNLVRVLSALEERFDIEFDASGFFTTPVTVNRLEIEIIHRRG